MVTDAVELLNEEMRVRAIVTGAGDRGECER